MNMFIIIIDQVDKFISPNMPIMSSGLAIYCLTVTDCCAPLRVETGGNLNCCRTNRIHFEYSIVYTHHHIDMDTLQTPNEGNNEFFEFERFHGVHVF